VKPTVWILGVLLMVAGAVGAVDVQLKDGTVIAAESYSVTGSYVMIKLPNGSQLAYDVADVDLQALRAAEAAAAGTSDQGAPAAEPKGDTISSGRSLKSAGAAGDEQPAGLAITDRDVKHMHGSGVLGEEEQQEADAAPETAADGGDFQVGGSVALGNVKIDPVGEGRWQIQGDVVNRNPQPVQNVKIKLEVMGAGEPLTSEVPVAATLGPDQKANFSHSFAAEAPEGKPHPNIRASVMWMREESRRETDYTKAGGVPHPSNRPQMIGGVTGADVRPTPIQ